MKYIRFIDLNNWLINQTNSNILLISYTLLILDWSTNREISRPNKASVTIFFSHAKFKKNKKKNREREREHFLYFLSEGFNKKTPNSPATFCIKFTPHFTWNRERIEDLLLIYSHLLAHWKFHLSTPLYSLNSLLKFQKIIYEFVIKLRKLSYHSRSNPTQFR